MTDEERLATARRAGLYGVWVMATFAMPVGVLTLASNIPLRVALIALMLIHIAAIPTWMSMQRRFLCSLGWAKEQGIRPERLKMFGLPRLKAARKP